MTYIKIKNVRKTLGGREVLRGVDLDVDGGDVVSLVGPSGSGKSTLLRCINRLTEIDSGSIFVSGRDIREYPPTELRRRVVLVMQDAVMFSGTVLDNVIFPIRVHGVDDIALAEKALEMAEVPKPLYGRYASKLSGGEKRRVALARAMVLEPEVLLLDEPTSGVDPGRVEGIESTVLRMAKDNGMTVIWVTHDTAQALRVGDRIAAIRDGTILSVANKDEFVWEGVY